MTKFNKKTDFKKMDDLQVDVLAEIGNIGIGNAVTSLSRLIGQRVSMSVPKVKLLEFKEAAAIMGDPEKQVFGLHVGFSGDLNGMMMFVLSLESARVLINSMIGKEFRADYEFSELDLSALEEMTNILASSYLGALATLINKRVMPDVPRLAEDMAGAVLSVPATAFGIFADQVLFIESVFNVGAIKPSPSGYFLLVPDEESFNKILSALGVM